MRILAVLAVVLALLATFAAVASGEEDLTCRACGAEGAPSYLVVRRSAPRDGVYCLACSGKKLRCAACGTSLFKADPTIPPRTRATQGTLVERCPTCAAQARRSRVIGAIVGLAAVAFLGAVVVFYRSQPPAEMQRTVERPRPELFSWAPPGTPTRTPAKVAPPAGRALAGTAPPGPPTARSPVDPALGDARARTLREQLAAGRFEEASDHLRATRDPDDRDFYVEALADWSGRPVFLDAWVAARPDDAGAWLVRARQSIHWAWEARGGGAASGVKDDAWTTFFARLRLAEQDLERASALDPEDPVPLGLRVNAALGLQLDLDEVRRRFDAAVRLDPDQRVAHELLLRKLCKKWGGSHEAMFDFARAVASRAEEGSRLHGLVACAHVERWLWESSFEGKGEAAMAYWSDPAVRAEVLTAWQRSAGSPLWRSRRNDAGAQNYLAFALAAAGDATRAKRELERIGDRATEFPWCYRGDPRRVAQAVRETGTLAARA